MFTVEAIREDGMSPQWESMTARDREDEMGDFPAFESVCLCVQGELLWRRSESPPGSRTAQRRGGGGCVGEQSQGVQSPEVQV